VADEYKMVGFGVALAARFDDPYIAIHDMYLAPVSFFTSALPAISLY